jgi:hypothetical protein
MVGVSFQLCQITVLMNSCILSLSLKVNCANEASCWKGFELDWYSRLPPQCACNGSDAWLVSLKDTDQ